MSDLAVVVMALAAGGGAYARRPLPLWLAAGLIAAGLRLRRPVIVVAGVALAASGLGARSWAGLHPPVMGNWSGSATLAGDPVEVAGAIRVDLRIEGKRVEAWARGSDAGRLRALLAGERVAVAGRISALPDDAKSWLAARHVSGRMTVTSVGPSSSGGWLSAVANRIRRTLSAGATSLPDERRALFTGFVIGDNRGQPAVVVHDFRASGLSHLLVVSGQNVAFVLALAAPAIGRMRLRGRLAAGVALLVIFGTLTRWEPSVLRAVGMTSISLLATTLGRPVSGLRVLSLAVTGLLLVDPLLVGSLGFQLSVGASAGLALLARPLARGIPGPRLLADAVAVTLAAQIGVAPVLIPAFGGIPSATLVANLVAGPVSGPLMMWGLAAGLPAGLVTPGLAALIHIPTGLMVGWIATVARVTASLPLGRLGIGHAVVLAAFGIVGLLAHRVGRGRLRRLALVGVVAALLAPVITAARPPPVDGVEVARDVALWRAGSATVVVLHSGRAAPDRLLDGLSAATVRRVDVVVATGGGRSEGALVEAMRHRLAVGLVLAPADTGMRGATVVAPGTVIGVGGIEVAVGDDPDRLAVEVRPRQLGG